MMARGRSHQGLRLGAILPLGYPASMHWILADGPFGLTSAQLALLVSGVAIVFVLRRWRQKTVKRVSTGPAEEHASPSALSVREVTSEVHALLADLEETSRRLAAQLDNRFTRLEVLLAEADEKIKKLESLTGQTPAARPEIAKGKAEMGEERALLSDAQRTLARLREERGAPPAAHDPAYQPIYTLADGGKSSREIAQELGRQPGEIELILALRRQGA